MELNDQENKIFAQAVAFVNYTHQNLFLTGKAGTGKTTFLKFIKNNCYKKLAVVAPTGVAAINAGGVTIHSFFQLPFGVYVSGFRNSWSESENQQVFNKQQLLSKLRLGKAKLDLIRELELLIIDEVSMVRADLLDAIDDVLRHVRSKPHAPFGGVQMIFIGDLFQLPPVVRQDDMRLLSEYYKSPFFFDARALKDFPPLYLELKKIYRQSNEDFIQLLNNVRNNQVSPNDLDILNSFYRPDFSSEEEEDFITLTSHNGIADRINQQALKNLSGKLYCFEALVERDFPERAFPADKILQLKVGAQIMFIKNDKGEDRKFYNGKIGTIDSISSAEEIKIRFKDESDLLELKMEKWQNIKYNYNIEADKIEEEELGTFSQFPIRLAWAITIHKSQGLTFDKAVIDAGASFAAGQVYVALSRLRSLNGLVLRSKIYPSAISTDQNVLEFSSHEVRGDSLNEILESEQKEFVCQSILNAFDWKKMSILMAEYIEENETKLFQEKEDFVTRIKESFDKIKKQTETAETFIKQLDGIIYAAKTEGYEPLHQRTSTACGWFLNALENEIISPLKMQMLELKALKRTGKLQIKLLNLLIPIERKKRQLQQVISITNAMCQSTDVGDWLQSLR
ncbi:ATP-dependent DNA helicase, partial [Arachidicoccus sp.]|uniref:ATP-dependent DNA helicase n=1 Tax=Arachidicoccus sp. TaxID=1872624 RepID=UPI003D1DCA80